MEPSLNTETPNSLKADDFFYASLHNIQYKSREINNILEETSSNTQDSPKLDIDEVTLIENNLTLFEQFFEAIKHDYESCGPQLQTALDKFAERYNMAKAKSVLALTTFLYNINCNTDLLVRMRSGTKIHVQIESVKRRKLVDNKENSDPHTIPAHKVRSVSKKGHRLSKNTKSD
ncbi:3705_t:CDS:2 [Gigaspora rosea]|nr:3705_t:CDS:2 [Gigaspora rosea]